MCFTIIKIELLDKLWQSSHYFTACQAYSNMIAERRQKVASGVEDTFGINKTQWFWPAHWCSDVTEWVSWIFCSFPALTCVHSLSDIYILYWTEIWNHVFMLLIKIQISNRLVILPWKYCWCWMLIHSSKIKATYHSQFHHSWPSPYISMWPLT